MSLARKVIIPNCFLVFSFVPHRNPIECYSIPHCLSPRHSPPPCCRPRRQLERGAPVRSGPRRQVLHRQSGPHRQEPCRCATKSHGSRAGLRRQEPSEPRRRSRNGRHSCAAKSRAGRPSRRDPAVLDAPRLTGCSIDKIDQDFVLP
jgi:hypothetical protein